MSKSFGSYPVLQMLPVQSWAKTKNFARLKEKRRRWRKKAENLLARRLMTCDKGKIIEFNT